MAVLWHFCGTCAALLWHFCGTSVALLWHLCGSFDATSGAGPVTVFAVIYSSFGEERETCSSVGTGSAKMFGICKHVSWDVGKYSECKWWNKKVIRKRLRKTLHQRETARARTLMGVSKKSEHQRHRVANKTPKGGSNYTDTRGTEGGNENGHQKD